MTDRSISGLKPWHVEGTPRISSRDVQFTNGDARLSGTVYLPVEGHQLPGLVGLHSASVPTRDAKLYRHLYEGLCRLGIAVLIFDRRGCGKSSGSINQAVDFEALADDAVAGQHALQKFPRVDAKRVGFWGLSQGGWLAVHAASRSKSAAFAISVSAPLVTPAEQMAFGTANLLETRGYSPKDVQEMLDARKAWISYLRRSVSRMTVINTLRKAETKSWFKLAFLPKVTTLAANQERDSSRREMDYDPIATVRKVNVPLLFIYGSDDPWIPVARSVKRVRAIMKRQPNIDYAVIADANHQMMTPRHEKMAFDKRIVYENAPQASGYFILIASWLRSLICRPGTLHPKPVQQS